jgi:hypothetical protein
MSENKPYISLDKLKDSKIFLASPMYGGMCHGVFTNSCIDLQKVCDDHNINFTKVFLFNESLITRARNYLADSFLRSDATHLVFVDSDIGFKPADLLKLVEQCDGEEKQIVCGPYAKKQIAWEKVREAVKRGYGDKNPNDLAMFGPDFALNLVDGQGDVRLDEPFKVLEGGTGFMCIHRSVFEKYTEAYPELKYLPDHARTKHFDGSREIMAFFDCVIDPETKRYLSEDYMFCQYARKIGIEIWMCPWMELKHFGTYMFEGSLPHVATINSSPTVGEGMKQR